MGEQDFSGDYGYDLADEVRSMATGPAADPGRRRPFTGIRGGAADQGTDGDFGYDLAHES